MSGSRVAIVGHCASGKSTVVRLLREQGVDAYSVAQEHSMIGDLWRHQQPDIVAFLDVSLDAIRERKHNDVWPRWIYNEQSKRLTDARANADVVVDTDLEPAETIADNLAQYIRSRGSG